MDNNNVDIDNNNVDNIDIDTDTNTDTDTFYYVSNPSAMLSLIYLPNLLWHHQTFYYDVINPSAITFHYDVTLNMPPLPPKLGRHMVQTSSNGVVITQL